MPAPSFQRRFFHLDLRVQVLTPRALRRLADDLAGLGYNGLVMEWEASYPFRTHPVIPGQYAYTPAEIRAFMCHCRLLKLEVIPVQQCFGHIEYILQHDRYAPLREDEKEICQLCPLKAGEALPLFKALFSELAETHDSEYFFIGCDETYVLGKCPECRQKAETQGKSKLFVDYVKELCKRVTALGKRPAIWADMLLQHPEAAGELPKNTILVDWNYGWALDRFGDPVPLLKTGLEIWGAPSLRSHPDNWYVSCWEKHLNNFRDFLPYALSKGYSGTVLTSWSTSGIYGFEWETFYEPIAMHPIRRVYPQNGFRLLLAGFARAVGDPEYFKPAEFVRDYAMDRFGLTEKDSVAFQQALFADTGTVYPYRKDCYTPPETVYKNVHEAQAVWKRLKPSRNVKEFAHFPMMAEIRAFYLRFKMLEAKVQSPDFSERERKTVATALKKLLNEARGPERRFNALMKGFLHPSEIALENKTRKRKAELLYDRLRRKR